MHRLAGAVTIRASQPLHEELVRCSTTHLERHGNAAVDGPLVLDEAGVRKLQLTPRELEILGLIAEGLSNKEIAKRVFVSEKTVKSHASRVFERLGARLRTEAVQLGKSWRLIP